MKNHTNIPLKAYHSIIYLIMLIIPLSLIPIKAFSDDLPAKGITSGPSTIEYRGDTYVFMKGNDNNRLEYKILRDGKWSKQITVPKVQLSFSPGAVVYNDKIYVFYHDKDKKNNLRFTAMDDNGWVGDVQLQDNVLFDSPFPIVYKNKLYVFHNARQWRNGRYYNGELGYEIFDGTNWEFGKRVENLSMSKSPAPVIYDDKVYVYHQGKSDNGELWYNVFDGEKWNSDTRFTDIKIKNSPTAVNISSLNKMFIFTEEKDNSRHFKVTSFDGVNRSDIISSNNLISEYTPSPIISNDGKLHLYYNRYETDRVQFITFNDNNTWSNPLNLPADPNRPEVERRGITGDPSVIEYNGTLYAFMQSNDNTKLLQYRTWNNGIWSTQYTVPGAKLTIGPGAVVFQNKIFVFHQDHQEKGDIYYTTFDGNNWSQDTKLEKRNLSYSPKAVVYKDKIYIFHHGKGKNGQLWYFTYDGKDFSEDIRIDNTGITDSPAPLVYKDNIYVYHQGKGNNQELWVNKFDGKEWKGDTRLYNVKVKGGPNAAYYPINDLMYVYTQSTNKKTQGLFDVSTYNGTDFKLSFKSFNTNNGENVSGIYYNNNFYVFFNEVNRNRLQYIRLVDNYWAGPYNAPNGFILEEQGVMDKKFGTFTLPASVHSYIITNQSKRVNQSIDVPQQLNNGIRYIEIDYNKWKSGHPAGGQPTGVNIMYNYFARYYPGFLDAGNGEYKTTSSALWELYEWLRDHPKEMVIMKINSRSDADFTDLKKKMGESHLLERMFIPENGDLTKYTPRDVLNAGKQIVAYATGINIGEYDSRINSQINRSVSQDVDDIDVFYPRANSRETDKYPLYDLFLSTTDKKDVRETEDTRGYFFYGSLDKAKYINDYNTAMDIIVNAWKQSATRPFSIQYAFASYGDAVDIVRSLNNDYNSIKGKAINKDGEVITDMTYVYKYPEFDDRTRISGHFNFPIKKGETVEIIPIKSGIDFSPASFTYTNDNGEDAEITFTIKDDEDTLRKDKGIKTQHSGFLHEGVGPTPFIDYVNIHIINPQAGNIHLQWYNMKGELIQSNSLGHFPEGPQQIKHHPKLPYGSYIYKATAGSNVVTGTTVKE